jgi:hypothetical protein
MKKPYTKKLWVDVIGETEVIEEEEFKKCEEIIKKELLRFDNVGIVE